MPVKSRKATTCPLCNRPYVRVGLTPAQKRCFEFIESYIVDHGISPSYGEISEALNLNSKGAVNRLVLMLKERGYIDYLPGRARSITVLEEITHDSTTDH